jgi:peptidoglycan/LPS O-acetylase OafA/YrhL
VLYHTGSDTHASGNSGFGALIAELRVGVPIFFLISGFLLYRPFAAADVLGAPAIRSGAFLWRRFLRIVPLYWVVLTIVGLTTFSSTNRAGGFFSGEPWWVFYGFGQVYVPGAYGGGLQQAWTLCIELTFYLLVPVYAAFATKLRRRGAGMGTELGVLLLLAVASQVFRRIIASSDSTAYLGRTLPSCFYLFAFGMALAILSVYSELRPASAMTRRLMSLPPSLAWSTAGIVYCAQAWLLRRSNIDPLIDVADGVIALFLLLPAVFDDGRRVAVRRFLAYPLVAWIGLVSYGMYLWHPHVLSALHHTAVGERVADHGFVPLAILLLACTAAISGVTYYVVERPVLRLKRRSPRSLLVALGTRRGQPASHDASG